MDELSVKAMERNEAIRFFGSLVATENVSEDNRLIINDYLSLLLKSQKIYVEKLSSNLDLNTKIAL
jgi:hypothetical protein